MENTNLDCQIEWGILIYQLPKEFMGKAVRILPKDTKYTFIDESGMRVYFSRKETCDEFIRRKSIEFEGILFYIFSTVTCLTVFGISPVASKETIKNRLKDKGMRVYDMYQIAETNHYRIILDVPEILANIELNPILLDAHYGAGFPMEFYCRVCRKEGHKQYQCQQISKENHGEVDKEKISVEVRSKNGRNYKEKNVAMPSSDSGIRNTRGRSQGIQSSSNLSARQNAVVTLETPCTSSTPTPAENLIRRNRNLTTKKNEEICGRTRNLRSGKNRRRTSNKSYPCKDIIKIIMGTPGTLPPDRLLEFVKLVYHKKKAIAYANQYAPDIPALTKQIRSVISEYNRGNSRNRNANQDIKILADLCSRLES